MVETICLNCGNRKSFEDNLIGKTFKCPSCSNPVTIQNVGSLIHNEPQSMTNSFADEIARADALKEEEAARKKAEAEAKRKAEEDEAARRREEESKRKNTNSGTYAIASGTIGILFLICRVYEVAIVFVIYTCYQIYKIYNTKKNDRNNLP